MASLSVRHSISSDASDQEPHGPRSNMAPSSQLAVTTSSDPEQHQNVDAEGKRCNDSPSGRSMITGRAPQLHQDARGLIHGPAKPSVQNVEEKPWEPIVWKEDTKEELRAIRKKANLEAFGSEQCKQCHQPTRMCRARSNVVPESQTRIPAIPDSLSSGLTGIMTSSVNGRRTSTQE
jgi:hypothetical protein